MISAALVSDQSSSFYATSKIPAHQINPPGYELKFIVPVGNLSRLPLPPHFSGVMLQVCSLEQHF